MPEVNLAPLKALLDEAELRDAYNKALAANPQVKPLPYGLFRLQYLARKDPQ